MYHAKTTQAASIEVFDTKQHQKLLDRMEIESELRSVTKKGELQIHYQPIIDLKTGEISSFEALVRWFHPEKGLVSPAHFIPIAEEAGLIGVIGEEIVRQVFIQVGDWIDFFGEEKCPPVSINLSCIQLMEAQYFKAIYKQLRASEGLCRKIRIEVTETAVMSDPDLIGERMDQLRDLGIKICIDDFGTGYSSLSYLHSYAYEVLKIDRSFVTMITMDKKLEKLVSNIINMSKDLGFEVVAEGIETEAQMIKLAQLGCEKGQGYLFARAMDRLDATKTIQQKQTYKVHDTNDDPPFNRVG